MERQIDFIVIRKELAKSAEEKKILDAVRKLDNGKNTTVKEFDEKVIIYKSVKE